MSNDIENNNDKKTIDIEKTINFFEETKDYDGLISFCKQIIKDCDDDKITGDKIYELKTRMLCQIALTYIDKEDYDNSIKYFNQILEIDPEIPAAYSGLFMAHNKKGDLGLKDFYYGASKLLKECEKKGTYKNYFYLAVIFYQLYLYTKNDLFYSMSTKYFLNAVNLQPKKHRTYLYLSSVYEKNKDYKEAIKTVIKALAMKPNNKDYIYQLGDLYYKSEKYKLALKMFEKYLKLHKKSNKYIDFILSKSFFIKNDYKSAINLCDKNISSDPESVEFYELLGDLYSKTCLIDKAIDNYKKALSIEPLCLRIIFKLADLYYNLEEYKKSLELYEKMDEIGPPEKLKDVIKNIISELRSKIDNK